MDDVDTSSGDIGLAFAHTPTRSRRSILGHLRRASSSFTLPSDDAAGQLPRSPAALSRSRTLPRRRPQSPRADVQVRVDAPALDANVVPKLRRWILCIVLVNFDLDLGPVVEGVYPPFDLSAPERENISFSSLPDSSQFDQGSQVHSFRIREMASPQRQEDAKHIKRDGYLYGFAQFTQRRESAAKRGYEQRSIVVLTHYPWPAIFSELVDRLGPMYLKHGGPMLEAACHNIANWSDPCPGSTVELGFLGTVLHVELPGSAEQQQLTETSSFHEKYDPARHILASMTPASPPPISLIAASLSHIWSIWECLVLCEPILIYGPSPAMTSQAIWWLLDILRPIPFAGDYRPYLTIHDYDYSALVNKNAPKAGLIVGVTNPFIASSCKHWPHILSLGKEHQNHRTTGTKQHDVGIAGPYPGWQTKTHDRSISKDKNLLKQLDNALRRGGRESEAQATLDLRRHFNERASAFLVPLNRYLATLIPTTTTTTMAPSIEPSTTTGSTSMSSQTRHTAQARLKPFNHTQFFTSMKTHGGSPLPFRSAKKQREFYERWLKSPAFGMWIAKQDEIVGEVLRRGGGVV